MNRLIETLWPGDGWYTLASFGQAQLLRNGRGQVELRGGTRSDRIAAKEWISLFMHDAVPRVVARQPVGRR